MSVSKLVKLYNKMMLSCRLLIQNELIGRMDLKITTILSLHTAGQSIVNKEWRNGGVQLSTLNRISLALKCKLFLTSTCLRWGEKDMDSNRAPQLIHQAYTKSAQHHESVSGI